MSKPKPTLSEVVLVILALACVTALGASLDYWYKKKIVKDAIEEIRKEQSEKETGQGSP